MPPDPMTETTSYGPSITPAASSNGLASMEASACSQAGRSSTALASCASIASTVVSPAQQLGTGFAGELQCRVIERFDCLPVVRSHRDCRANDNGSAYLNCSGRKTRRARLSPRPASCPFRIWQLTFQPAEPAEIFQLLRKLSCGGGGSGRLHLDPRGGHRESPGQDYLAGWIEIAEVATAAIGFLVLADGRRLTNHSLSLRRAGAVEGEVEVGHQEIRAARARPGSMRGRGKAQSGRK